MTRRKFSRIEKAILIRLINSSDKAEMKKLNKSIYRADFKMTEGWRELEMTSYKKAYNDTVMYAHKKMIDGRL